MTPATPSLLLFWESFLDELLDRTQHFPKNARFTFSSRLDGLALDVYESLIEARYSRSPEKHLRSVNLLLEKLRLLLRLSYRRDFLSERGLRVLIEKLDEAGRMVGGWLGKRSERRNKR